MSKLKCESCGNLCRKLKFIKETDDRVCGDCYEGWLCKDMDDLTGLEETYAQSDLNGYPQPKD